MKEMEQEAEFSIQRILGLRINSIFGFLKFSQNYAKH